MRGKALHMYGVFGLAPNLSVNNDQKKVCRSRRSEPLLLTERPEVPSMLLPNLKSMSGDVRIGRLWRLRWYHADEDGSESDGHRREKSAADEVAEAHASAVGRHDGGGDASAAKHRARARARRARLLDWHEK